MLLLLSFLIRSLLALLRSRRDVALENVVLRHQLQVALRTNPSPRLTSPDRVLWVWLRLAWPAWRDHLHIVEPATVLRWHRKGWRLYWTWKSRSRLGRPRLSAEVRDLIATISRDNPLWGSERIRGELLKPGIERWPEYSVPKPAAEMEIEALERRDLLPRVSESSRRRYLDQARLRLTSTASSGAR